MTGGPGIHAKLQQNLSVSFKEKSVERKSYGDFAYFLPHFY